MSESLDKLSTSISKLVESYTDDVKKEAEKKLDETADEIVDYITQNCPRGDGGSNHLADSFIKTEIGSGVKKTVYISSKTKGRLVHLIELGFKHKSGKHVAAHPFMRPAYDTFTPEMIEDIKKIINGGNIG